MLISNRVRRPMFLSNAMSKFFAFLFFCPILLNSCGGISPKKEYASEYDIEIKYIDTVDWTNKQGQSEKKFSKDSLYLASVFYFESQSGEVVPPDSLRISITRNGENFIEKMYEKSYLFDPGYDVFNCGSLNNIQTIGIRVNNGNIALVEIDSSKYIIKAVYSESHRKLSISFLKSMPFFR